MAAQASTAHQNSQKDLSRQETSRTRTARGAQECSEPGGRSSRTAQTLEDRSATGRAQLRGTQYSGIKTALGIRTHRRSH